MTATAAPIAVLSRGDHVRLALHHPVPARYRGTVAEVATVLTTGRVGLFVKRRSSALYLTTNLVAKIDRDSTRKFPQR